MLGLSFNYISCELVFCLHVYLGAMCVRGASEGQKRLFCPQERELQMVVKHSVDAGNRT